MGRTGRGLSLLFPAPLLLPKGPRTTGGSTVQKWVARPHKHGRLGGWARVESDIYPPHF